MWMSALHLNYNKLCSKFLTLKSAESKCVLPLKFISGSVSHLYKMLLFNISWKLYNFKIKKFSFCPEGTLNLKIHIDIYFLALFSPCFFSILGGKGFQLNHNLYGMLMSRWQCISHISYLFEMTPWFILRQTHSLFFFFNLWMYFTLISGSQSLGRDITVENKVMERNQRRMYKSVKNQFMLFRLVENDTHWGLCCSAKIYKY